jgi:RinA family phage transcriptional activator
MKIALAAKLKKAAFKHVEAELYCCHDMLKEIQVIRNNIMFCWEKVDENIGGGRDSLPRRPMESIAVRLGAHKRLAELEEIANAVYTQLPERHHRLIRLWNWTRRHTRDGLAGKLYKQTPSRAADEMIYTIGVRWNADESRIYERVS